MASRIKNPVSGRDIMLTGGVARKLMSQGIIDHKGFQLLPTPKSPYVEDAKTFLYNTINFPREVNYKVTDSLRELIHGIKIQKKPSYTSHHVRMLDVLPDDMIYVIGSYMRPYTLNRFSSTCKTIRNILQPTIKQLKEKYTKRRINSYMNLGESCKKEELPDNRMIYILKKAAQIESVLMPSFSHVLLCVTEMIKQGLLFWHQITLIECSSTEIKIMTSEDLVLPPFLRDTLRKKIRGIFGNLDPTYVAYVNHWRSFGEIFISPNKPIPGLKRSLEFGDNGYMKTIDPSEA